MGEEIKVDYRLAWESACKQVADLQLRVEELTTLTCRLEGKLEESRRHVSQMHSRLDEFVRHDD